MKKIIKTSMLVALLAIGTFSVTTIFANELPANPCDKDGCTTQPGSNNGSCVRSAGGEKWCCVSPAAGATKDCYSEQ